MGKEQQRAAYTIPQRRAYDNKATEPRGLGDLDYGNFKVRSNSPIL